MPRYLDIHRDLTRVPIPQRNELLGAERDTIRASWRRPAHAALPPSTYVLDAEEPPRS